MIFILHQKLKKTKELTYKTDVFALGNVFYLLLMGITYKDDSELDLEQLDPDSKALLSGMVYPDAEKRFDIGKCIECKFIQDHLEKIGKSKIFREVYTASANITNDALKRADEYIESDNTGDDDDSFSDSDEEQSKYGQYEG
jgi:hypothetical protein